jgi:2-iminoacetate synthase
LGRTGEHFMEFSVPGFIKEKCGPNSILTFAEYLEDYAPVETYFKGWNLIEENINEIENRILKDSVVVRVSQIKNNRRDLLF